MLQDIGIIPLRVMLLVERAI